MVTNSQLFQNHLWLPFMIPKKVAFNFYLTTGVWPCPLSFPKFINLFFFFQILDILIDMYYRKNSVHLVGMVHYFRPTFSKILEIVKRKSMLCILIMYGISQKTISAIETIHDNAQTSINTSDGPKYLFSTLTEVLQEDTFAIYLFI